MPSVRVVHFDQCQHGAETAKPTRLIYFGLEFSGLSARCQHGHDAHRILRGRNRSGRDLCFALARL
eukprot:1953611-Alexandrium_andersonii.AAC.1